MSESHALEDVVSIPNFQKFQEGLLDTHLAWFTSPEFRVWRRIIGATFFLSFIKDQKNDPDFAISEMLISQLDEIMNISYDNLEGTSTEKRKFYQLCSELSLLLLTRLRDKESEENDDLE